jgi:prepilin-type N-terminal cleavage/methylation domain-containing protein/prepilin-type processing-associated H-X9-DG protein
MITRGRSDAQSEHAFTLVELLVVIGIIAILIGVLLPALSAARRQANSVKCLASMRSIGQLYRLYEDDQRGWWPIVAWKPATGGWLPPPPATTPIVAYWYNFLEKYATKAGHLGNESSSAPDIAQAQLTIFWGCPAWDGKTDTTYAGGIDKYQTGIAMQQDPTFQPDYPSAAHPAVGGSTDNTPDSDKAIVRADYSPAVVGRFFKATQWSKPDKRALLADCRYWILEVDDPGSTKVPEALVNAFPNASYDFYRHGKYPRVKGSGTAATFDGSGGTGKVAFNVLFCDGHAVTLTSREDGYRAVRMKFPG